MSNFFLADRIKETSRIVGTVDIQLDGAVAGFSSFSDFYASGDTVYYAITDGVQYEVGSGLFVPDESDSVITRNPFRSSDINVGPWSVNATSNDGPTDGQNGLFYPLWLSRSAAVSGVRVDDGPFSAPSGYTFDEYPGVTFYGIAERAALGVGGSVPAGSGEDYDAASQPVTFGAGLKEVYVTYPGKTAVFNGFGIGEGIKEPKQSGIPFWENEQIINYSENFVWDNNRGLVGINQPNPQYSIDVGGLVADSIIRASGFVGGGSGVMFSGGQLTDTVLTASGGRQWEPFRRNRLGENSAGIIQLSGLVDQIISFQDQGVAQVLAGPLSGVCDPCPDGPPAFRLLRGSDLPIDEIGELAGFVVQNNVGLDGTSINVVGSPNQPGMIALFHSSGEIVYDSGLFFDATSNRLSVAGTHPTVQPPAYTLDVKGESTLAANSGYFNQLIFADGLVRIGDVSNNTNVGNSNGNYHIVSIGENTTVGTSNVFKAVAIGKDVAVSMAVASGSVALGDSVLKNASGIDDTVALGTLAGFGLQDSDNVIFVGRNAGAVTSGVANIVAIGKEAVSGSVDLNNIVVIGNNAGLDLEQSDDLVSLGRNSMALSSGINSVVAIGRDVASNASGIDTSVLLGQQTASGAYSLYSVVAMGEKALHESSGVNNVFAVGTQAGRYAHVLNDSIVMGNSAARSGEELERTIAIGGMSAANASGSFNTYIGQDAGIGVSGHNNLEIVSSGANVSFLGAVASNKINIKNLIAGDSSTYRLSLGYPSGADPEATLVVNPRFASEPAFVIRHQQEGNDNYFQLQSGDATTFFNIDASGSVVTSGYMQPSGGLSLPNIPKERVMINSGDGGYMLWNDAGTLIWNGRTVDLGGGNTWNLTNGAPLGGDTITDGQTVIISGVSGVEAQYNPADNFMRISASGLSGVLQNQITAQTYTFDITTSGEEGAARNTPFTMESNSVLAISGVSGVAIDFSTFSDGVNRSGLYVIGYDNSNTYTFDVSNGVAPADTILNGDQLDFTGVSGLALNYNESTQTFEVGASGLSGVLEYTIQESGNYIWEDHVRWRASGIAVSGLAVSNFNAIQGITQLSATSGITVENDTYITDKDSFGHFKALEIKNSDSLSNGHTIVIITDSGVVDGINNQAGDAVATNRSVFIGPGAAASSYNLNKSVAIGDGAGYLSSGIDSSPTNVYIGKDAGRETQDVTYSVLIGELAGYSSSGHFRNINIGRQAGYGSAENNDSISIGYGAGQLMLGSPDTIAMGQAAAYDTHDCQYAIIMGWRAGYQASGSQSTVYLGEDAGYTAKINLNAIGIGARALQNASGCDRTVAIGNNAGAWTRYAQNSVLIGNLAGYGIGDTTNNADNDINNVVAIGNYAGFDSDDSSHSVFIGAHAGRNTQGNRNSINISNRSVWPDSDDPVPYSAFYWASTDDASCLDIGESIQGVMTDEGGCLHIGRKLDDVATVDGFSYDDVNTGALTLTPPTRGKRALRLRFHTAAGSNTAEQDISLVSTNYRPLADNNEPTNGSFDDSSIYSQLNEIINGVGMLRVPVATSKTGSGSSTALFDSHGNELPKGPGVIAVYHFGTSDYGFAVCVKESHVTTFSAGANTGPFVWRKIAATSF